MNQKQNILDAWILIEQLSEGDINKKDRALYPLNERTEDLQKFFSDFLLEQKMRKRLKEESFKKSGLVLYFDIFNFKEIIETLRQKYKIAPTDEETRSSDKFSFCLYLDHNLSFLANKLFFTVSGYIRHYGELPEQFLTAESTFREDLNRKFAEGFNPAMNELFQKYKVSPTNFRYKFVENLEIGAVQMHSFFIDDLQKAKHISTANLDRYFEGFQGDRVNLDGNKKSERFEPYVFQEILQPRYYPLGRFPSHPDHALSLMQQVAVNLALNEQNDIRSINGPPGTGKTTLLKDIFADLLVQQAVEICGLSKKAIEGEAIYEKQDTIGFLPDSMSSKNIVVASSNNGAVQNIVNELPRNKEIANVFQELLREADYFRDVSNSGFSSEESNKQGELGSKPVEEKNWGTFSLEGGASININKLLLNVGLIQKHLDDDYKDQPEVYTQFLKLHQQLNAERQNLQQHSEAIKKLSQLKLQYDQESTDFDQEGLGRQRQLANLQTKIELCSSEQKQAQRNFDVVNAQKPRWFWLQKMINKKKIASYLDQLTRVNEALNIVSAQQKTLEATQKQLNKKYENLESLKQEIDSLEELQSQSELKGLDFSKSYEVLQKSNPWSTQQFRILQSQLFICALQVRKQFLYENRQNVKAARLVWSQQWRYVSKRNGQQLISESWQWLNFTIPVISTTFASFGRMFKNLKNDSIGNLFVDEAGQALPQASVGAIFRSRKVLVVGDPSQIKPVLTLDSNMLNLIGQHYKVDESFISGEASTQTLVDNASQYGFYKKEGDWIGVPLWVHRRSDNPMFQLSNKLSYDDLMVQGKSEEEAQGKSKWYHCQGTANDKFVKEQAELLKTLIEERLQKEPELKDSIFVISPFKNVADQLERTLDQIKFTKREKGKATNVGTVHTFQGKEAEIVYFVLGADSTSAGSAKWAVSEPNMMNVAATRAKKEFYVIGDKDLYAGLGCEVANTTLSIIDAHEAHRNEIEK